MRGVRSMLPATVPLMEMAATATNAATSGGTGHRAGQGAQRRGTCSGRSCAQHTLYRTLNAGIEKQHQAHAQQQAAGHIALRILDLPAVAQRRLEAEEGEEEQHGGRTRASGIRRGGPAEIRGIHMAQGRHGQHDQRQQFPPCGELHETHAPTHPGDVHRHQRAEQGDQEEHASGTVAQGRHLLGEDPREGIGYGGIAHHGAAQPIEVGRQETTVRAECLPDVGI
jgi:hypothetical protein